MVEVRRGSLRSTLDGKEVLHWSGDFSRLSVPPGMRLEHGGRIAISAWQGESVFHRVTVRGISGPGRFFVVAGGTLAASGSGQARPPGPEMKALVEWVISLKGYVIVHVGGIATKVTEMTQLPSAFEELIEVDIPPNRPASPMPPEHLNFLAGQRDLKRIALRNLMLTGADVAPVLRDKPALLNLSLVSNRLDDSLFTDLQPLPMLESVDFTFNRELEGAGIEKLGTPVNLRSIILSDTGIHDATLPGLRQFRELRGLHLNATRVTDAGLPALATLTQLDMLQIKNTNGITVRGLESLRSMTKLRRIEMHLGRGVQVIADFAALGPLFPGLRELVIDFAGPKQQEFSSQLARLGELAPLSRLVKLELRSGPSLQASNIVGLEKLPALEILEIGATFKDGDVALLKGMKSLHVLRLFNAKLSEAAALELASIPSLREVRRGGFSDAGLRAFTRQRPDVRISN